MSYQKTTINKSIISIKVKGNLQDVEIVCGDLDGFYFGYDEIKDLSTESWADEDYKCLRIDKSEK